MPKRFRSRSRYGKLKKRRLYKRGGTSKGIRKFKKLKNYRKYNVHSYKRYTGAPEFFDVMRGTSDVWLARGMDFGLSQIANISEFTSLYDKYRITGVKITFRISEFDGVEQNASTATAPVSNVAVPTLWIKIDDDDANTPTVNDMRQASNARCKKLTIPRSIFFKPKVKSEIFRDSTSTAYSPIPAPMLDMANTDVPHYGLKFLVEGPSAGPSPSVKYCTLRVEKTYYFNAYNVR